MATVEDPTKPAEAAGLLTKAAELKPMTVAPPASTPTGMTQQNAGSVTTAGQTYTPSTYTQDVDPTKTTAGLLSQVMDKNGELMRIASQRGYNQANRRGMGNSSIAAQASMGAMIDAALPIAQSDASIHQQQALTNQQAMNFAASALNDVQGADMRMRQEAELTRVTDAIKQSTIGEEYRSKYVSQYMDAVANVLNNKDMTPAQMQASINRMYENLQGSIALQASIEGIDFGQYKPGAATGQNQTAGDAVNAAFGGAPQNLSLSQPEQDRTRAAFNDAFVARINEVGAGNFSSFPLTSQQANAFVESLTPAQKQWALDNWNTRVGSSKMNITIGGLMANATNLK